MKRRRRAARGPYLAIVVLLAALGVVGGMLWHIYPEYRRLRAQAPGPARAARVPSSHPSPRAVVARLYFARVVEERQRLVAIRRKLPAGVGPARAALEELIGGELPQGCERPLPKGTALRGVRVEDAVASADFTRELVSNFEGGSENEGVTVYAIVNTLTSLPTVHRVQILVEAQRINTIGGHLDVSQPLGFDGELVVGYP